MEETITDHEWKLVFFNIKGTSFRALVIVASEQPDVEVTL
jgi:hypothetical protein